MFRNSDSKLYKKPSTHPDVIVEETLLNTTGMRAHKKKEPEYKKLVWVLKGTGTIINDKDAYKEEHSNAKFEQITKNAANQRVLGKKLVWVLIGTGTIIEDTVAYKNEHPDAVFEMITSAAARKRVKVWVLTGTGIIIEDTVSYKKEHPGATFE